MSSSFVNTAYPTLLRNGRFTKCAQWGTLGTFDNFAKSSQARSAHVAHEHIRHIWHVHKCAQLVALANHRTQMAFGTQRQCMLTQRHHFIGPSADDNSCGVATHTRTLPRWAEDGRKMVQETAPKSSSNVGGVSKIVSRRS